MLKIQYRIEFVGTKTTSFINERIHLINAKIYFKIINYSFPYRETFFEFTQDYYMKFFYRKQS